MKLTELETIIINLNIAVERGEMTRQEAIDLLDAFQDHEFEALREQVKVARSRQPVRRRNHARAHFWAVR